MKRPTAGVALLLLVAAMAGGCGSESVCPTGTAGSPCLPLGDVGSRPHLPGTPGGDAGDTRNEDVLADGDTLAPSDSEDTNDANDTNDTRDTQTDTPSDGVDPDGDDGSEDGDVSATTGPPVDTDHENPNLLASEGFAALRGEARPWSAPALMPPLARVAKAGPNA